VRTQLTPLLAATVLTLVACSADGDEEVTLVEGVTEEVQALDNSFRPEDLEVAAGTEVTWTNKGRNEHDITPADGDDFGVTKDGFAPGDDYRFRFTEPGTYRYYCTLHATPDAGMIGTIVVTG
jgi:plastocyanin